MLLKGFETIKTEVDYIRRCETPEGGCEKAKDPAGGPQDVGHACVTTGRRGFSMQSIFEAQASPHGKGARPLKNIVNFEKVISPKIPIPTFDTKMSYKMIFRPHFSFKNQGILGNDFSRKVNFDQNDK